MIFVPSKLWIGSINGIHAVFDPQIQVAESRWVLLYIINRGSAVAYRRILARADATRHQATHPQFELNLKSYEDWITAQSPQSIAELQRELRQKDFAAQKEISRVEALHRKYLSLDEAAYKGTLEPTETKEIRDSACLKCHTKVSSHLNLKCKVCGWLVCGKCGGCGCGYS